jgi:putative N6-adenine-specific DNA methylase
MLLLITCPSWFVSTLNQELKYLRFKPFQSFDTGTYVETDRNGMMTINLWSRIASKVYVQLQEWVSAETFDQLFTITQAIDRTQWLPATEYLVVNAFYFQSTLMSEKSIQSIVHKAILTQLTSSWTSLQKPTKEPYEIMVQIINNQATFFLNTSWDALHKRWYRLDQWAASLKENVAAGLVLMSGRRRQQQMRDPCCGSGTICIEAAMIARNIAPGLLRVYAFEQFINYDEDAFKKLYEEAQTKSFPDKQFAIFGSDIDLEMLEKSRANAERAGVADTITFFEHNILDGRVNNASLQDEHAKSVSQHSDTDSLPSISSPLPSISSPLVIITNPPYGKRLVIEWLKDLYRALIKISSDATTHLTCITSFPEFSHLLKERRPRKDVKNGQDDVHVRMKPRG